MTSNNNTNFNYVSNQFTSFAPRHLNDSRRPTVELHSAKEMDMEVHEAKWQYSGNREEFYSVSTYDQEYTREEKALLRKIDWFIMPVICTLDFLQFLDKSTINYAALLTFKQDLHLEGSQFSLLGSIFYLGYLLFQLPNNYLLQRIPIGRYIGILVVLWGTVLFCTAFGTNFSQVAAMRFCLGFFEAGIYPSLTLLVSTFYRRSEQVARLGAFWICNGFALFAGGLIGYGIGHMTNVGGLKSWQWIMILMGGATILMGFVTFFFLIDSPKSSALRLNAEEEILVEERTKDNATVRTTEIKVSHIISSLKELRFWCFSFACLFINLQNGAMTIYSGQITLSFGFNQLQSMLLTAGAGGCTIIFIVVAIISVHKTQQTIYTACAIMTFNIIGLILLLVIPVMHIKLVGFYMAWSYCAVYVLLVTSISNNVTGYTKKIFYNGVLMVFYTVGNFVGPLMMVAPPYLGGMLGYIAANCLTIILLLVARWRMAIENRKRLLLLAHNSTVSIVAANTYSQDDISDEEDKNFIYLL